MSVTDEYDLVDDRVARLQTAYRDCRIVLFPEHCGAWPRGVEARPVERLYAVGRGGLVVERHLDAFLASGCAWWLKVDPDTVAWRPLLHLPEDTCFFGTLQDGASLQGGCIGGTRAAAAALLASGALRAEALLDPAASWARGDAKLAGRVDAGVVSFEHVHAWACREAGIELRDHPEIHCESREPPADPWRWAFTHPHKWLDPDADALTPRAEVIERGLPVFASTR
jgi:hypothetical protein